MTPKRVEFESSDSQATRLLDYPRLPAKYCHSRRYPKLQIYKRLTESCLSSIRLTGELCKNFLPRLLLLTIGLVTVPVVFPRRLAVVLS